ncbi:hypothetical protein GE09DRAFT_1272915 [Coniochaeta sp. 2T2.1]|nr:hypothetical protein GE09DRAFT_1272915 [Coniochaeta sp. 2T2.1]
MPKAAEQHLVYPVVFPLSNTKSDSQPPSDQFKPLPSPHLLLDVPPAIVVMAPGRTPPVASETQGLIKGFELVMLLEKDQEAHTRLFEQKNAELKAQHEQRTAELRAKLEQQKAELQRRHVNAWKDNVSRRKTEVREHWERSVDLFIEVHKNTLVPPFARTDNTANNGTPMSNGNGESLNSKAISAATAPPATAVTAPAASATPSQTLPLNYRTIVAAATHNDSTGGLKRASDTNTDEGPAKRRSSSDPCHSVAAHGPSSLSQYETRSTSPNHGSIEDSGPSKYDRDIAYLNAAWGGHGWFPHGFIPSTHRLADRLNQTDTQYLCGITRLALNHKIDLPSLYQPGGVLFDAMAGSVGTTPVWTSMTVKVARTLLHQRVLGRTGFGSGAGPVVGGEGGASTSATPVTGAAEHEVKENLEPL